MIGDGPRGATYEMILAKVKYCSQVMLDKTDLNSLPIQIVATTATLDNKRELAQFLNAHLYERDFRPVELHEVHNFSFFF
jgi:replicative superfamily II helicase